MKMNQAVLNRVYKMRERKGFKATDTKSFFYVVCRVLYCLVFIWYVLGPSILALSWWIFPDDYGKYTSLFHKIFLSVVVVGTYVAGITLLKKRHEIGAIFNAFFITVGLFELKYYMHRFKQFGIDDGFVTIFGEKISHEYIWRHFVPAFLMLLLGAIICGIYMRERLLLKRDYNKVLDALYIGNKDKFKTGSEEEWEALLESLDDSQVENQLDKYHTEQYFKNKDSQSSFGMKWFSFLIDFGLVLSALCGLIFGIVWICGGNYFMSTNGQTTSDVIHSTYGVGLKILDVIYGVTMIVSAVFDVYTRFRLAKFKSNGPTCINIAYGSSVVLGLLYNIVSATICGSFNNLVNGSMVGTLVACSVVFILNYDYFKKRKHMFTN